MRTVPFNFSGKTINLNVPESGKLSDHTETIFNQLEVSGQLAPSELEEIGDLKLNAFLSCIQEPVSTVA